VPAHLAAGHLHVLAKDVTVGAQDFDRPSRPTPTPCAPPARRRPPLVLQNRGKDAIAFVGETVRGAGRIRDSYALLGNLYSADGQKGKAVAQLQAGSRDRPASAPARLGLLASPWPKGNDERRRVHFKPPSRSGPGDLTTVPPPPLPLTIAWGGRSWPSPCSRQASRPSPPARLSPRPRRSLRKRSGATDDALARTAELLAGHTGI
jgi:hypothetical protein